MPRKKKQQRKSKPEFPSNAAFARYWRGSDESDEAWDKFHDAAMTLLKSGKLGHRRCEAIMAHLDGEEAIEFVVDMERLAATDTKIVLVPGGEDSEPAVAMVRLFGVPVSGARHRIDALVKDERFDHLTRAIRSSGYAIQDSNIVLLPVPVSISDMATLSPADVHRLTQDLTATFMRTDMDSSAAVSFLRGMLTQEDAGKEVEMVSRVLIGAQMVILNEHELEDEDLRELDALALLRGEGPEDADGEDAAQIDEADERWGELVDEGIQEEELFIHSPVPWNAIRHTLLSNYVHSVIGASFHMSNRTGTPGDAEVSLTVDGPFLTLTAEYQGEHLTQLAIPRNVVFDGAEEFLEDIMSSYRIRQVDDGPLEAPALN